MTKFPRRQLGRQHERVIPPNGQNQNVVTLQRYIVPGLVVMAVMVGGGYSTGREIVEYFISKGPATGLVGMAMTGLIMGFVAMISFELARKYRSFDYRTFTRLLLGRFALLFEFGYFVLLLLYLSVMTAAASSLGAEMFGSSPLLNSIVFICVVAWVVLYGSNVIERVISIWAVIFLCTYGSMVVVVVIKFGGHLSATLRATPIEYQKAALGALIYTGFNPIVPICIYVARNFRSRSEALIAGALVGPMIMLPGLALSIALSAFYPAIVSAPIPVSALLTALNLPVLGIAVELVILTALLKSAVGILHGLNERLARAVQDKGGAMPQWMRGAAALIALIVAVFLSSSFGIIDLVKHGYRFCSYFFIAVFLLPLMTRGLWLSMDLARRRVF
jgi:uncharacterized membrane protein YkvI